MNCNLTEYRRKRVPPSRFLSGYRGAVSVEVAILAPVLVLVLAFVVDIAQHLFMQQKVSRAAVALAEIVINEMPDPEEDVSQRVFSGFMVWDAIARDIIQDPDVELEVQVAHAQLGKPDPASALFSESVCSGKNLSVLYQEKLGAATGLRLPDGVEAPDLSLVRVCARRPDSFVRLSALVFPVTVESHFASLRKDWHTPRRSFSPPPPRPSSPLLPKLPDPPDTSSVPGGNNPGANSADTEPPAPGALSAGRSLTTELPSFINVLLGAPPFGSSLPGTSFLPFVPSVPETSPTERFPDPGLSLAVRGLSGKGLAVPPAPGAGPEKSPKPDKVPPF